MKVVLYSHKSDVQRSQVQPRKKREVVHISDCENVVYILTFPTFYVTPKRMKLYTTIDFVIGSIKNKYNAIVSKETSRVIILESRW